MLFRSSLLLTRLSCCDEQRRAQQQPRNAVMANDFIAWHRPDHQLGLALLRAHGAGRAGFASTVFWPLSHVLAEAWGWRVALLIFAGLHLLICMPIHRRALPALNDAQVTGSERP
mgnify:CR=1 FL=1